MKVMMIFDQTQAGLGGKESPDLAMGGKAMAIGSCGMFERFMQQNDGKIIATLYCGDGTFKEDPEKNAANRQRHPSSAVKAGSAAKGK